MSTKLSPMTRWIIGITAAIVALVAGLWLSLPSIIQSKASKYISSQTGYTLRMDKPKLSLTGLSAELNQVSLSDPEGQSLLQFGRFFVDLEFAPLLQGETKLRAVHIDGLKATAVLLPEGKSNWTQFLDKLSPPQATEQHTEQASEKPTEMPSVELVQFKLSNSSLHFEDRRTEKAFITNLEPLEIDLENLSTKANREGEFEIKSTLLKNAKLDLKGKLSIAQSSIHSQFELSDLDISQFKPLLEGKLPIQPPQGVVAVKANIQASLAQGKPQVIIDNTQVGVSQFGLQVKSGARAPQLTWADLQVSGVQFDLQANQASIQAVKLTEAKVLDASRKPATGIQALNINQIALNLTEQQATVDSVELVGGATRISMNAQGKLDLLDTINGLIPETPPPNPEDKPWAYSVKQTQIQGHQLALDADIDGVKINNGLKNINVTLGPISEDLSKPLAVSLDTALLSGGALKAKGQVIATKPEANFQLQLQRLALSPAQPFITKQARLQLASGTIDTGGKLKYSSKGVQFDGDLSVDQLMLYEAGTKNVFLAWKRLHAPRINATEKSVRIPRLNLKGLDTKILIAEDKSTNIQKILVQQPDSAAPKAIDTKASAIAPAAPPETKPVTSTANQSNDFSLLIDRFAITESDVEFADRSLVLPFGTKIHDLKGSISGLSTKPDAKGVIELDGDVDNYGQATIGGQLSLLDPTKFMDIQLAFRNVEMTTLTPYSATFAGRRIDSGKLTLNLEYNIQNKQLNSNNQILIDQLKLGERVDSPTAVNLPLDLAIAILEDSNGRIDLGIPVTGSLDDPQFSYGAIVWKAFTNVITKIVTAPFRALGALFGSEEAIGSISFTAGVADLAPPQRESVSKLSQALSKRPNIQLSLSGTYSEADKIAIQKQQLRRAVALASGVKLAETDSPGPIAITEPEVQKALERLANDRLPKGELAALKTGYKSVNPEGLKESMTGQMISSVGNLLSKPRALSQAELDAIKGKDFYAILVSKLEPTEKVTPEFLNQLAEKRVNTVMQRLLNSGVAQARLTVGSITMAEPDAKQEIPLKIDMQVKK